MEWSYFQIISLCKEAFQGYLRQYKNDVEFDEQGLINSYGHFLIL